MTTIDKLSCPEVLHRLSWVVIISMVPVAAWVAVTDVGRPAFSGQPAGQASAPSLFHVSAKGDHQAQGVRQ